ncbi:MAG: SlyX family protein [Nitrospirae bacterium]|nr:SlyX family protein [Nitrospirota bacterium]
MNEDRLSNIEAKIAFQENTIKDLSDAVYDQQKQITTLKETVKRLIDRIIVSPGEDIKDEKPPHY